MSHDPLFDHAARDWLSDGPTRLPERVVQSVLLTVETTPQSRGLRALWRNPRMLTFAAAAVAAVVIGAVAIGPTQILRSTDAPGAPTLPPTTCPTPLESGIDRDDRGDRRRWLGRGRRPQPLSRRYPSGWDRCRPSGKRLFQRRDGRSVRRIGTDGVITTVASAATRGRPRGTRPAWRSMRRGPLRLGHRIRVGSGVCNDDGGTTAVVGTGFSGSSGNDGPAVDARSNDQASRSARMGSLYFDDLNNYRRVDPDGVIHAFAGTTTPGFSGDGGPAIDAAFGDRASRVLPPMRPVTSISAITGNRRIRQVDPKGVITTIAGDGTVGPMADGDPGCGLTADHVPVRHRGRRRWFGVLHRVADELGPSYRPARDHQHGRRRPSW